MCYGPAAAAVRVGQASWSPAETVSRRAHELDGGRRPRRIGRQTNGRPALVCSSSLRAALNRLDSPVRLGRPSLAVAGAAAAAAWQSVGGGGGGEARARSARRADGRASGESARRRAGHIRFASPLRAVSQAVAAAEAGAATAALNRWEDDGRVEKRALARASRRRRPIPVRLEDGLTLHLIVVLGGGVPEASPSD
jgi:hypothetical protein